MKKVLLSLLTISILGIFPKITLAQEYLSFKPAETQKETYIIQKVHDELPETITAPYSIAKTDLNNDSIDEYVLKSTSCEESTACTNAVIALKNDKPIVLLTTSASSITISNRHDYGVRRLEVAENKANDFLKTNYQWSPNSFTYIKQ